MAKSPTVGVVCIACSAVSRVSIDNPPGSIRCASCGDERPFALPSFVRPVAVNFAESYGAKPAVSEFYLRA